MHEVYNEENFGSIRDDLLRAISICEERISVSKSNEAKYTEYIKNKGELEKLCSTARNTANHMNKIYKNLKYYLENKKETSKLILEEAIRSVSNIVEDSNLSKCTIEHKNNKTKVLNELKQDINNREGSAARSTMGILLSYTCLKAIPNAIQIMFLDEALFTLSSTTSVNMRTVLSKLSESIGIVGIEQKDILYRGITIKKYKAVKSNKISKIIEVKD